MPYALKSVCFAQDVPDPTGKFVRILAASEFMSLTRDGDTLVVEAKVPERGDVGRYETVVLDYNWAIVAYSTRQPEPKVAAKK